MATCSVGTTTSTAVEPPASASPPYPVLHATPDTRSSLLPATYVPPCDDTIVSFARTVGSVLNLPQTPRRFSSFHATGDTEAAISPVVLDIERRLFTRERSLSFTPLYDSAETIAEYTCQNYSPRPDDFYFDDGLGGHVMKLELPESERELLSAEGFLSDIRKIEAAIEVSHGTVFIQVVFDCPSYSNLCIFACCNQNVKSISIINPDSDDIHDPAKLDEREQLMMQYLEILENYEASGYRMLREACMGQYTIVFYGSIITDVTVQFYRNRQFA
jgi:hypothetical protein